jgi:hypothetical protein
MKLRRTSRRPAIAANTKTATKVDVEFLRNTKAKNPVQLGAKLYGMSERAVRRQLRKA